MLWNALGATFETLLYWEVYVAGFIYLLLAFVPAFLLSLSHKGFGPVLAMIAQPVFKAAGMLVFVTLVFPIAARIGNTFPWDLPLQFVTESPWDVLKMCLQLIVVSVVIAFIPILGGLQSFSTLVLGVFATQMVLDLAGVTGVSIADLIPTIPIGLGILAVGAFVSIIGLLSITVLASFLGHLVSNDAEAVGTLISVPFLGLLGFAPLLVYYAWLGLSLSS